MVFHGVGTIMRWLVVTSGKILPKAGIKGTGKFLWGIGNFILAGADVHDRFFAPKPSDGDGNNIVGDDIGTLGQNHARAFCTLFNLFSFYGS